MNPMHGEEHGWDVQDVTTSPPRGELARSLTPAISSAHADVERSCAGHAAGISTFDPKTDFPNAVARSSGAIFSASPMTAPEKSDARAVASGEDPTPIAVRSSNPDGTLDLWIARLMDEYKILQGQDRQN